ncbi:hypothetical protein C6P40_003459 [Pichia californica]|uniref:Ribosomal protein L1 n=1 Tax=Pichia californica TaxID=460514 RepID=A0A9P6WIH3_9ASCO|nr:hypothetical protein C6P40_003459 [[Candida] californica]
MPPRKTRSSTAAAALAATKATIPKEKIVTKNKKSSTKKDAENISLDEEVNKDIVQELNIKETVIDKAVEALSKWNQQQTESSSKKDLFETDDEDIPLYLQITSKKYFSTSKILKPRMINVPNSIYDLEECKVCVFVKDDLIDEDNLNRIEILKENKLKNLGQIITVKELKGKYQTFESKRKLLSEYDLFLTDSSIANMIPKLLGKTFFGSSKFPLTISLTDNNKKLSIDKFVKNFEKSLYSISYMLPMGINMSIRLGMLGQNKKYLNENIKCIIKFLQKFPIRLIQLKLKNSPSLPIFITDKVYDENDIEDVEENEKNSIVFNNADDIPISIYAEGLKELGLDEEEADKIFGRKKRTLTEAEISDKNKVENNDQEPNIKKTKKSKK